MKTPTGDFLGTERYEILRPLGAGGMGAVYEVYDRERDRTVALKTLIHAEASAIYRFKREFRALADVVHPNLVSLYELMSDGRYWFFTMELVDGVNFLEHVRTIDAPPPLHKASELPTLRAHTLNPDSTPNFDAQMPTITDESEADIARDINPPSLSTTAIDLVRLRAALKQLAEGVYALHQTSMLHRDIKPSNVMVTQRGRVVLLDFGLATEVTPLDEDQSLSLAGTPAYMSPEQGAQRPVSEASDWYSVGVILYEALTGRLPFIGKFFEVLSNKQKIEPPAPNELAVNVPADLNALCCDLLRRDPQARPTGDEILRRLGANAQPYEVSGNVRDATPAMPRDAMFVGRERQLQTLAEAFRTTRAGRTATVYIHGNSGIGKSALVEHFLEELQERVRGVVLLEGRCYERESVPYKALDGVVDSLSKYLLSLPQSKADVLMPRDVPALARLFPVMLQVQSVSRAPQREQETPEPLALRRRAFAALRELLARISERHPLVIYIDDYQWADADSTALLEDLLRPPDAPPLLLIASFRSEEIESKLFLQSLLQHATESDTAHELAIEPLTADEARRLARSLLGVHAGVAESFIEAIVKEAGGSPFFVEQLARYALAGEKAATTGITLAEMLDARLRLLPEGARAFIETLAVAGRPVNPEVAYQATGLKGDEHPLIASLRSSHFLRGGGNEKGVELYHDRIREMMTALLDPKIVKAIHRRLALTLEAKGFDDPEALFEHYLGAGERERAATYAVQAAKKAASALAFARAALLYRRALELSSANDAELVELKAGLGEALVNAGRPAEAAVSYLDAARYAEQRTALEFQRRAAEQLLMGGHIDEGLDVIRDVLAAVGLKLASGPRRALLSLLVRRAQLWMRGLKYTEREVEKISADDLLRIDICWSVAAGLAVVDNIRGADFQTRHLLLALRAGEPYRIARALAVETGYSATPGGAGKKRSRQFSRAAELLAQKVGHPHAIAMSTMNAGLSAYLFGEWRQGALLSDRAAEILRDRCTGVMWELSIVSRFQLTSLLYLGEVAEISRRLPFLLATAKEQGNRYGATDLRTRLNIMWLAADDPDRARLELIEALEDWPHKGFHLQHYSSMFSLAQIMLYTNDGAFAWKYVNEQWPDLAGSMLLRIQFARIEARHLLARCALAAAVISEGETATLLKAAGKLADQIASEEMKWSDPLATAIRAGISNLRGDVRNATRLLQDAAHSFDLAEMHLYAAATRRRLGQLMGGDEGLELIRAADEWMRAQKIKRPELMTRTLVPGFADDVMTVVN
jgi:serine/threonine protein kinase